MSKCKRCGKTDHATNRCKAPFMKSWIGRPAIVMKLRAASGAYIELTADLSDELFALANALQLAIIKQPEDS